MTRWMLCVPIALLGTTSCGNGSSPLLTLFTPLSTLSTDNPVTLTDDDTVGLAVADLNGDGLTDLATAYPSGWPAAVATDHLYPIIYPGTWGFLGEVEEEGFAIGDFVDDPLGFIDGVVTIHGADGDWASVLEYSPFLLIETGPFARLAGRPTQVVVGDWNGDGHLDVAILEPLVPAVQILLGDGTGVLAPPPAPALTLLPTGAVPFALVAADFDGDGAPDLAVTNGVAGTVSVFRNVGGGFFAPTGAFPALTSARSLAAGDLDGDGHVDLVAPGADDDEVAVLLGAGDGTFGPPSFVALAAHSVPTRVALADFDGDGDLDLAVGLRAEETVQVFRNGGSGGFSPVPAAKAKYSTGLFGPAQELVAADVDGDGRPDLVLLVSGHFVVLRNTFGG